MSTIAGNTYSTPRGINLKSGILRFDESKTSNPLVNDSTGWGLYVNSSNELVFWNKTSITTLGSASQGGGGSLDSSYSDGHTITVDDGATIFNDSTAGAANVIDINKSGAGSGSLFDVDITAAFTGKVIDISYGTGIASTGILFTSTTDARTGSDLLFTDTSTATHNNIEINAGGSGAGTGIAYTNSYNGSPAGNAISLTFDDNDGLSTGGILITRGTGVRTDNAIAITDSSTGNVDLINIDVSGVYSGDILSIVTSAAATGNIILLDMDGAVAATALRIQDTTTETRTQPYIEIISDCAGSAVYIDANLSGTSSGNFLDITYSGINTGNAINVVMANNVAGAALNITGAGIRTDSIVEITTSETGSVDGIIRVDASGVFTGSVLTLTSSAAATTGSLIHLDLDAGVAYKAITIDHAGARTVETILVTFDGTFGSGGGGTFLDANITMTGASASPFLDIDITGVYTGNIFDVLIGASAATGDVLSIDLGATATASQAMVVASGAMLRSTANKAVDLNIAPEATTIA